MEVMTNCLLMKSTPVGTNAVWNYFQKVTILHLMGATCSGKSTLIDELVKHQGVGAVQIGKILRKKYGEAYFKGQGAPAHTANEAIQIYMEEIENHVDAGKKLIIVDGQPRDVNQAKIMLNAWPEHKVVFYSLFAEHEVREERAKATRVGDDLDLTVQRLNNDYKPCYMVAMTLLEHGQKITAIDTGAKDFSIKETVQSIMEVYGPRYH